MQKLGINDRAGDHENPQFREAVGCGLTWLTAKQNPTGMVLRSAQGSATSLRPPIPPLPPTDDHLDQSIHSFMFGLIHGFIQGFIHEA
ncbi:hypothetical protein [Mesorhizobium sp. M1403]|uniref:hypothetical protein n=1 Tax=Mesorhizobium sp. M1403 TaxID=2957097 RepID=UPI00333A773F